MLLSGVCAVFIGLARDKARVALPRLMYWPMWLLGALPPSVTDPLLRKAPRKD